MMVTFVSQCEKKAIKRTQRILDAFAERIGDRTWQTVITEEGLLATKRLLKKTVTKNTAVSCHCYKLFFACCLKHHGKWIQGRGLSFAKSLRSLLLFCGNSEKF